jgi:hypothetical protein
MYLGHRVDHFGDIEPEKSEQFILLSKAAITTCM